jgi:hypothetical protein
MSKLIEQFKANPNRSNRQRLQSYLFRHPMATCFASHEEIIFLRTHDFI